jgi:hypothetical protein
MEAKKKIPGKWITVEIKIIGTSALIVDRLRYIRSGCIIENHKCIRYEK